jgi:hypothetical protein
MDESPCSNGEKIAWSGWVYFSMVILVPLHRFFYNRRLKANEIQS